MRLWTIRAIFLVAVFLHRITEMCLQNEQTPPTSSAAQWQLRMFLYIAASLILTKARTEEREAEIPVS